MKLGIPDKGLKRIAQEYGNKKTLRDLAEFIKEKESELAYGSETSVLGAFVNEFDYVDSILSGESDLDPNMDVTEAYDGYVDAYQEYEVVDEDVSEGTSEVTLSILNDTDDPKKFGGELLADDGRNQLWSFGNNTFANRFTDYEDDDEFFWDADVEGWFPNNDPGDYSVVGD